MYLTKRTDSALIIDTDVSILYNTRYYARKFSRKTAPMDQNAAITGWGWYSPAKVLSNHDLEKLVDTNDAWIQSRTGIRERRIAGPGETTSTMATIAAKQA